MSEFLIQITSITILGVAFVQVALLGYMTVRTGIVKRRLWQTELAVLEKQLELHTLKLTHAEEKLKGSWEGYRKFSIVKKEQEKNSGICSFYLTPHDGKSIPLFEPGQYLFFKLDIPKEKKPVLRSYSLSDSPNKEYYRVSIKKMLPPASHPNAPPGVSSSFFHENLKVGDIVDVRAPSGNFFLDVLSHKPVVLIGGGVGVTPVLSMLNTLCDLKSQREVWFFFGIRNGDEHIMEDHFRRIEQEFDTINIRICYSRPTEEDLKLKKYHYVGRVNIDLLKQELPSNNYEFYFCGPTAMMDSLETDLQDWGVPKSSLHFERFVGKTPKAVPQLTENIPVLFSKSQKILQWNGTQSVLDVALENEITLDYSCKRGMCGLCQTAIKSGAVDYDETPEYLSNLDKGMCLPCVAKPKPGLELDA